MRVHAGVLALAGFTFVLFLGFDFFCASFFACSLVVLSFFVMLRVCLLVDFVKVLKTIVFSYSFG